MTTPKTIEVPEELLWDLLSALNVIDEIGDRDYSREAQLLGKRIKALLTKPQTTCGE